MTTKKGFFSIWLFILGAGILVGLYTAFRLFTEGHGLFNTNDVLLWTLPLGAYVFLALTSSGLTLLAGLPMVLGFQKYQPMAKRLVFLSIATLLGAFVNIGLELGSVFNMIYILLSPNLSSPIWWMGAIYSVELVLLAVKFWRIHVGDSNSGFSRFLGVVSVICALIAPLMIGSVFGLTESRITYFGPVMSIYCLFMAILSGLAFFLLYNIVQEWLVNSSAVEHYQAILDDFTKMFLYALGLVTLFTILKIAIESATTIPDFWFTPHIERGFVSWRILNVEVLFGLLIPFALMLFGSVRKSRYGRLIAAALSWMGALGMHMQILLAGQSRPIGPKAEQLKEIVGYMPSIWEWLVLVFALTVMLLLYTLGEKYLKLDTVAN